MRSRVSALIGVALLVALTLPAVAGARSGIAAAQAEHNRIVAYWTPERVAHAQWKSYERQADGTFKPNAKPGGGSGAVTGASWTGNGIIEKQSGRILFHQGTGDWICSGSVVTNGQASNGYSTVLTAGHCAYDGTDGWATDWMFIPDFDDAPTYTCGQTVYGCWTATNLAVNTTFYTGGGFGTNQTVAVDYAFAIVGLGGKTNSDLDVTVGGAYALKTSPTALNVQQWAFGYPAAGRYHGKDLVYCTNSGGTSLINDPNGADTWGMACNMTGGSSGGPWVTGTTNPGTIAGQASSVNSYGYSGLTYMFGPKFNSQTTNVLNAVISGSGSGATLRN